MVTSGYGPRTVLHVYLWFGWIIRRSHGARAGLCMTFRGAVRRPYALWTRREIDTTRIGKNPAWASSLAVRSPHGLFTGCLRSLNPYGARKLIMHALKLYGPRTGGKIRTAPHGARVGSVNGRTIFVKNSPRTGPGSVMWLRHYQRIKQIKALDISSHKSFYSAKAGNIIFPWLLT